MGLEVLILLILSVKLVCSWFKQHFDEGILIELERVENSFILVSSDNGLGVFLGFPFLEGKTWAGGRSNFSMLSLALGPVTCGRSLNFKASRLVFNY